MSLNSYLRSLRGVLVAVAVLSVLFVAPSAYDWASRGGRLQQPQNPGALMDAMLNQRWFSTHPRLTAQPRPDGLTPFGRDFRVEAPRNTRGLIVTMLGYHDLKNPSALLDRLPAEFRSPGPSVHSHAKGTLQDGVNIIQIGEASLQGMGYERIASEVGRYGRVLADVPDRGVLVQGSAAELARLAAQPFVEATGAYLGAFKLDPQIGQMPLIQASRAKSKILDLQIQLWHGEDAQAAKERLARIVGTENVSDYSMDGSILRVKAERMHLVRLADDPATRVVTEVKEMVLMNSEVPVTLMIGNSEDSFNQARPYNDLGIDGGGIGALLCTQSPTTTCTTDNNCTNNAQCVSAGNPTACCTGPGAGTCTGASPGGVCRLQRFNNGTAPVPPQIVAVTDNGISIDAVHFSQSLTQVTDLTHGIGPAHRKVHSIQIVEDNGTSCDALLSGANTHGNVVAGIIAGAPGDFGLFYSKAIDPADGLPLQNISLDALAHGARIIMQDAALPTRCVSNELIEVGGNIEPGVLLDRLNAAICPKSGGTGACLNVIGGGDEVHLQVLPFGVPPFDNVLNNPENGMYSLEAQQIDTFLVNNRDYMVFSPAGSQGADPGDTEDSILWTDYFDGTPADDDPNLPRPAEIPPPATAKNSVTVGATFADTWTVFGNFNEEENDYNITSHGPATEASGRTAPLLMTVGADGTGVFGYPLFMAAATNRSHDNDNTSPVENEIDDQNTGTSFSAGYATAAGAIVRDYFAQGFYPTATRQTADRMPRVSGSLVRAALVASANFLEQFGIPIKASTNDKLIANTRGADMGTIKLDVVGIIGNNQQGYGRPVLDQVLPLSNYPPTRGLGAPDTVEYPAAGVIVYDMLGTGEAPINNTTNASTEKTFVVNGVNTVTPSPGTTRLIENGQLRIALSWPDPPSTVLGTLLNKGSGTLVNDLDLEVESPGPDNDISTTGDNVVYDGNSYIFGNACCVGQWSQGHPVGTQVHDTRNNIEAVHLSSSTNALNGNQLVVGTWKVRVKRGAGGATAGQITAISGANEDLNFNGRRDSNEPDTDGDGLLDAGGQPYALVIAGPVLGTGQTQTWNGAGHALPGSIARLDKYQYSCSDAAVATILDPDAASAADVSLNTLFQVVNAAGTVLDEERGIGFTESPALSHDYESAALPTRLGSPAVKYNGVLEGDNGQSLLVRYTDSPRNAETRARFQCTPNIIQGALGLEGHTDPSDFLGGGCDGDQFLDANERLTYSVAIQNFERVDDLNDVVATLTPVVDPVNSPGAAAIRVLDSPKNIGRIPGGQRTGITFSLFVDPTVANGLSIANRKVRLELRLDGMARGVRLSRTIFDFDHVINADAEALHYSTDFPAGGREVRDFNRNLQIDLADKIDPFKGIFFPDEDITFSTLFVVGTATGKVSNTLGEDLDDDNFLDPGEDTIPNSKLDRGILASASGPSAGDKVPWNFDSSDGGWVPLRSIFSKPGGVNPNPVWEYKGGGLCSGGPTPGKQCFATADCGTGGTCVFHSGICGFQSTRPENPLDVTAWFQNGGAGIWHTGDGDPTSPAINAQFCENYPFPHLQETPNFTEFYFDVLESPIIQKVHQLPDSRNFPYTVEFQRVGFNLNIQTHDYAGGDMDLDNDIDSDVRNCLLCQYFYYRFPDIYSLVVFQQYASGIDPKSGIPQRTFGPLTDPDNSFGTLSKIDGDETGFTGFTANTNTNSTSPIPVAGPDYTPFPRPGPLVPQICNPNFVCSNALTQACVVNTDCPSGGVCQKNTNQSQCEQNTAAGPERNMDISLLDYEDGVIQLSLGPGPFEPAGAYSPGPAANRWQLGLGFYAMENDSIVTDYGIGFDDPVLEWDEVHPLDESAFVPAHTPACNRFGGAGQPAGQPCATLTVDRLNLYECNDTVEITVDDPKLTPGTPNVTVFGVTDSDNLPVSTGVVEAKHPRKSFTLPAVQGTPGLFRGNVTIGALFDNASLLFAGVNDSNMTFYYLDPTCDGDGDGTMGENSFGNLDGDNIAGNVDNCPVDYNPLQEDTDGDARGNFCDNCPGVKQLACSVAAGGACTVLGAPCGTGVCVSDQTDSDADGVGDACDFDDADFDGLVNSIDNCPDVYNPNQVPGGVGTSRGAACNGSSDTDNDGTQDRVDNCVRTANPTQSDKDNDGMGDACDGDCLNPRQATLTIGSCNLIQETLCTSDAVCPQVGHCSITTKKLCTASNQCAGNETCVAFVAQTCVKLGLVNDGSCGTVNDDADGDSIPDNVDNCPNVSNPAIIANTTRQLDTDQDGRGDICDAPQTLDDDNNGIPDDAVSFTTTVSCKKVDLPRLIVLPKVVRDLNGDHDQFADAGEVARLTVLVKNNSDISLTGVSLILGTSDPDISCVTRGTILIPSIPAGATVDTGVAPGGDAGEFEFIVSPTASTINPTDPAKGDFIVTLSANEAVGTSTKTLIQILLDLDPLTGGLPPKVAGYDNLPGNSDDGILRESFDLDRDGDGLYSLDSRCHTLSGPDPTGSTNCFTDSGASVKNDTIGVTVGTAPGGINVLAAVGCAGYNVPAADPGCVIDPDNDMDWHIHCKANENGTACLNNADLHKTPANDNHARDGDHSLHWGIHFDLNTSQADTVKFREIAAFMTNPINLTPAPELGDLELSFYHIASMVDNNIYNLNDGQANDYGDVQIQFDRNADPAIDDWSVWDKLAPFENVYDHIPYIWSKFGTAPTYCNFNPTDTGTAPPAPRGVHEIMCYPIGVWSHCGNLWDQTNTFQCPGPGVSGSQMPSTGTLWVQSKFSLANYLGQRVRIRWIAEAFEYDPISSSYQEVGGTWANFPGDEGWYVDDILITGVLQRQANPPADVKTPANGACPTKACDATQGDSGFNVSLSVTGEEPSVDVCVGGPTPDVTCVKDADCGSGGRCVIAVGGEKLLLSAVATTNPGGCIGGGTQFRYFKDNAVVQDWSQLPTFVDNPSADAAYRVQVRCSVDTTCTSSAAAGASNSRTIQVFTGDGADIPLSVSFNRTVTPAVTTLSWPARVQTPSVSGFDVFRGLLTAPNGDPSLATLTPVQCNVANGAPGTTVQVPVPTTVAEPSAGSAHYYLVGHNPTVAGGQAPLGRRGDGTLRPLAPVCP